MDEIIARIKEAYNLEADADVAEFLDLNPSTLSMQKIRGRLNLKLIIEKCTELNKNWLLDGEGPIWRSEMGSDAIRIPLYSSFEFRNDNELDLGNSEAEGTIMVDIPEEWDHYSSAEHLIGYPILEEAMVPKLQVHDIGFFDLKNTSPDDGSVFLLSYDQKIICGQIQESGENYIINAVNMINDKTEVSLNSNDSNIIGEMIWALHRI